MRFFTFVLVVALLAFAVADVARHKAKRYRNHHHVLAKQGANAAEKVGVLAKHKAAGVQLNRKQHAKVLARKQKHKNNVNEDGGQMFARKHHKKEVIAAGMVMNKAKKHHANKHANKHGILAKNQAKVNVNAAGL